VTLTFIYMMFILKIPILMLFWIVRWAWKAQPVEEEGNAGDGGTKSPRSPIAPRGRGPHGEPQPPAPKRVRTAKPLERVPHR
jgi:hypothetical protein